MTEDLIQKQMLRCGDQSTAFWNFRGLDFSEVILIRTGSTGLIPAYRIEASMAISPDVKQLRSWIRSQHLICLGTDFVFETVDQAQLERFECCLRSIGGYLREVNAVGNWPMGPNRSFKILRACATVPRPGGEDLVQYWAKHGSSNTRFSEISS